MIGPAGQLVGLLTLSELHRLPADLADEEATVERAMDRCPCLCHEGWPCSRAHRLFAALGLRHLLVLGPRMELVGILTRHDLQHGVVSLRRRTTRTSRSTGGGGGGGGGSGSNTAIHSVSDGGGTGEHHLRATLDLGSEGMGVTASPSRGAGGGRSSEDLAGGAAPARPLHLPPLVSASFERRLAIEGRGTI